MGSNRRPAVRVSKDTHDSVKLLAAALDVKHLTVVDRAVAILRHRHTDDIEAFLSFGKSIDLSGMGLAERVELHRDAIVAAAGGRTVWVLEDRIDDLLLAVDPASDDDFDVACAVGDLVRTTVFVYPLEYGARMGYREGTGTVRRIN